MVWPLTWVVIVGTLPGIFMGVMVRVAYLPDPNHFKLFAAGVLLYIGIKMVGELLKKTTRNESQANSEKRFQEMVKRGGSKTAGTEALGEKLFKATKITQFNFRRLGFTFYDESFDLPFWGIFILSLIVGIVGGIYGIGGGSIIAPFYSHLSVAPDWLLGILFGVGGMVGMYLGARCQKFVPAKAIKWMLAFIMVLTATKYIFEFFGY